MRLVDREKDGSGSSEDGARQRVTDVLTWLLADGEIDEVSFSPHAKQCFKAGLAGLLAPAETALTLP